MVHVRQPYLMCIASLLNHRYLQVSGSVMVMVRARARARARVSARVTVRDGIGIGFRRNHSWSSTFTPRRNHSLCLKVYIKECNPPNTAVLTHRL